MFGGPQTNFESDFHPSSRSNPQDISSVPFLDMSSFQPLPAANPKRQSGFESMESMDSSKTTPMNYMRKAHGMPTIVDPIIRKESRDSEDGNIGTFLRSAAPAGYDSLDIETFGEIAAFRGESGGELTPEPWTEPTSSPLTARESLRQLQPSNASVTNQFGLEHLNIPVSNGHGNNLAYQQDSEPYYAHDPRPYGANLDDGYFQNQAQNQIQGQNQIQNQSRPLSFPPRGQPQHHQAQLQYQAHGQGMQTQQAQGQYVGHHQSTQQGQGAYSTHSTQGTYGSTTPRIGAVGAAAPPRRTSHPPPSVGLPQHHYQQQGQGQGQGQGYGQGQYTQYAQHQSQSHQQAMHQYNHGSYASAPQTPLSVYRSMQGQGQGQPQSQSQYQQYTQQQQYQQQQQHQQQQNPNQGMSLNQGLRSLSHSSEEDSQLSLNDRTVQPFGRASRDHSDLSPGGGGSGSRALYPGPQSQMLPPGPPVRTPRMGASGYPQHHLQSQPQGQGQHHNGQSLSPVQGHGQGANYPSSHPAYSTTASHTANHSAAHSTAATSMLDMQQELVYQVQFKRGCRAFTLSARAGIVVNERDFVVVEADRGEDIGIVVEVMTMIAFLERRMNAIRPAQQAGESEDQNVGCILRLATLHERQQLPDKFHAEKEIVQSCNDLAQHGFGLPITVFEAEFQFDRRKLTVYYDCTVRIDFRDFVRQLYSTYKARIWMKKMSPTAVPEVQPFAAMALATGVQFSAGDK